MDSRHWLAFLSLISFSTISIAVEDDGIHLFRYVTADGESKMSTILPPDAAVRGYEIINTAGDVLDIIPPALTEDHLL